MFQWKRGIVLFVFVLFATFAMKPTALFLQNLKQGSVSQVTIYSPGNLSYEDQTATTALQQQAAKKVQNVYNLDPLIQQKTTITFENFINSILALESHKWKPAQLQKKLQKINNPYRLNINQLKTIYGLNGTVILRIKQAYKNDLSQVYASGITTKDLTTAQNQFKQNLNYVYIPDNAKELLTNALSQRIVPNLKLNAAATQKEIALAEQSVQPVMINIQKGQLLVRTGDIVTAKQMMELEKLGIVNTKFTVKTALQRLPYIALLFLLLHFYSMRYFPEFFQKRRHYIFEMALLSFSIILTNILKQTWFDYSAIIVVSMIATIFWGRRYATMQSILMGLLLSIQINNDYLYLLNSLTWTFFFTLFYEPKKWKRGDLWFSGLKATLGLLLTNILYFYAYENHLDFTQVIPIFVSCFSGFMITPSAFPAVENLLQMVTSIKLHELSDLQDKPLLNRLMKEAPATWNHSFMVGNLAESAADKLGLNGMFLRVGGYYHDVGKIKNPKYFIENAGSQNPHDALSPLESAQIILEHPLESVRLCKKQRLPEPLIQLIESHHSDSLVEVFYHKAKEQDPSVTEEPFRYQTPTPKSKEQGLLLLADSADAYFRSLHEPNSEELYEKMKKMLFGKFTKGDLRDCELTVKDIYIILDSFVADLIPSVHKREIQYPDMKDKV